MCVSVLINAPQSIHRLSQRGNFPFQFTNFVRPIVVVTNLSFRDVTSGGHRCTLSLHQGVILFSCFTFNKNCFKNLPNGPSLLPNFTNPNKVTISANKASRENTLTAKTVQKRPIKSVDFSFRCSRVPQTDSGNDRFTID